jgi:phage shock protein PspC (stress-responsive transcriptional regulator)
MKKQLLRRKDSKLGGVCGGLEDYFGVDKTIFRILFLIGLFTPLPSIFIYLLLWVVIPKEPKIVKE